MQLFITITLHKLVSDFYPYNHDCMRITIKCLSVFLFPKVSLTSSYFLDLLYILLESFPSFPALLVLYLGFQLRQTTTRICLNTPLHINVTLIFTITVTIIISKLFSYTSYLTLISFPLLPNAYTYLILSFP